LLIAGNTLGEIRCFDLNGEELAGFPIFLVEAPDATPTFTDLDQNGELDVVAGSNSDRIWAFQLGGTPGTMEWPTFKHDFQRTGNYENVMTLSSGERKKFASVKVLGPFPNPSFYKSTILLNLPEEMPIEIELFDVSGRRVGSVLEKKKLSPGFHRINFEALDLEGRPLPSGVYFLRIETGKKKFIKRFVNLH